MKSKTSYLEAIQAVPGDTAAEKFRWVARFVSESVRIREDLTEILESQKVPRELLPLFKVEAANVLKHHEALTESLKSEDSMIVGRALRATWYFDGSKKDILTVEYFIENVFAHVTLTTRGRIVKALANNLARKEHSFAERFFLVMSEKYGQVQALPLLIACRANFVYDRVVERDIILPERIVKVMFKKSPDFVIRYLKLGKCTDGTNRKNRSQELYKYMKLFRRLVKKHLDAFCEIYEAHKPVIMLSRKCAEVFLRNGKDYLMSKPNFYVKILPLKMIDASRLEILFPKLFPEKSEDFKVDDALHYLEYYPEEKRAGLLLKSYQDVYEKNLLEKSDNVTPSLARILPIEEREKQARIKMEKIGGPFEKYDSLTYERAWWCYLSTNESLPAIKERISKTSQADDRMGLLRQMIYTCKVNHDTEALLDTLNYIGTRHKNETGYVIETILLFIDEQYDFTKLSKEHWTTFYDMIRRAFVKHDLSLAKTGTAKLIESALRYKLVKGESIDQAIDMLVDVKSTRYQGTWNVLKKYPEYEKKCLQACLAAVEKKFDSDVGDWRHEDHKDGVLEDLIHSMYEFNKRHVNVKPKPTTIIEGFSLQNYPWLVERVKMAVARGKESQYAVNRIKQHLKENETNFYHSIFGHETKLANVRSIELILLLKNDPKNISDNWEKYLKACEDNFCSRMVWRFLREVRWYKDIPMMFAEKCLRQIEERVNDSYSTAICILAILLDGRSYAELIGPLLPSEKTIDIEHEHARDNYYLVHSITSGMKRANPPVPLELIGKLCESDYLSKALEALRNTCSRTALPRVIQFVTKLSEDRVSVRKHGIRLFCRVSPLKEVADFLMIKWKAENNHSIRELLFHKILDELYQNPGFVTWSLFKECASSLSIRDRFCLLNTIQFPFIPDEYIVELVRIMFKIVDTFVELKVEAYEWESFVCMLLNQLTVPVTNLLPEELCEEILKRYLCHVSELIEDKARWFLIHVYVYSNEKELGSRLHVLGKILRRSIKERWNHLDPKHKYYYPLNHSVRSLFNGALCALTYKNERLDFERKLVDGFLTLFLDVLTPDKDPESFLGLILAKERLESQNTKDFGSRVVRKLPELINVYSSNLMFYIAIFLRVFLRQTPAAFADSEEATIDVMEALVDSNDYVSDFTAANLMTPSRSENKKSRYEMVFQKLFSRNDVAITSILYTRINNDKHLL